MFSALSLGSKSCKCSLVLKDPHLNRGCGECPPEGRELRHNKTLTLAKAFLSLLFFLKTPQLHELPMMHCSSRRLDWPRSLSGVVHGNTKGFLFMSPWSYGSPCRALCSSYTLRALCLAASRCCSWSDVPRVCENSELRGSEPTPTVMFTWPVVRKHTEKEEKYHCEHLPSDPNNQWQASVTGCDGCATLSGPRCAVSRGAEHLWPSLNCRWQLFSENMAWPSDLIKQRFCFFCFFCC